MKKRRSFIVSVTFAALLTGPSAAANEASPNGRAFSLKLLQEQAEKCPDTVQCPGYDTLFDMTRVIGFVLDPANHDLIVVGQIDPSQPPLHTEDFVVALRNAWLKYAERDGNTVIYSYLGCSIDPDPRVAVQLKELGESLGASLSSADENIEKWHSLCRSPQKVSVLGMPFNTRFAKILVQADYDMKRIVDGSDSLEIDGFVSLPNKTLQQYKAHLDSGGGKLEISFYNRFEFVPSECPYHREKGGYFLDHCPVKLMTEEQHLQETGRIAGTGRANPLAQQFCDEFTAAYEEVAKRRAVYAELEGLFRLAALTKLMYNYRQELDAAEIDLSYFLESYPVADTHVDSTLDGISNLLEYQSRTEAGNGYQEWWFWLPSCGGVTISYEIGKNLIARQSPARWATLLLRAALGQRPSPRALFWTFVVDANLP